MVDQYPQPYSTASPVLATFDFADIESGLGYQEFSGYSLEDSSGISYSISTASFDSDAIETSGTGLTTSFVKKLDLDFDTTIFQLPRTMKGKLIVNAAIGGNTGVITYVYLIVKIRKWDGSTETEVANAQSKTKAWTGGSVAQSFNMTFPITIPETIFNVGDVIRATVELWTKGANVDGGAKVALGHSPNNFDGTLINPSSHESNYSQLIFNIPFKLDL